ncbi:MAG: hypothetical protein ACK55X_09965 [Synechococcaceae cyanobacterium]|jgi:hypothetical protein
MSPEPSSPSLPSSSRSSTLPLVPLLLLVFALADLRVEFQLLADRFTVTTLLSAIRHHWLAVVVLASQPSLWRHYRRSRR